MRLDDATVTFSTGRPEYHGLVYVEEGFVVLADDNRIVPPRKVEEIGAMVE